MNENTQVKPETTDSWPLAKIIKHVFLPKPKDAPKAGKKEWFVRVMIGLTFLFLATFRTIFSGGDNQPTEYPEEAIQRIESMTTLVKTLSEDEYELVFEANKYALLCGFELLDYDFNKAMSILNNRKSLLIKNYGDDMGQALVSEITTRVGGWNSKRSAEDQELTLQACLDAEREGAFY